MGHRRLVGLAATTIVSLGVASLPATALTLVGNVQADDGFVAFLSSSPTALGTEIGSGNTWYGTYAITPTQLSAGANYIHIEVVNTDGPGGLLASFSYGGQTLDTNTTQWTAVYNSNYWGDTGSSYPVITPQSWVNPTAAAVNALNGTAAAGAPGAWGPNTTIDANALWLDAADPNNLGVSLNTCPSGRCTVDFSAEIFVSPSPTPSGAGLAGLAVLLLAATASRRRQA